MTPEQWKEHLEEEDNKIRGTKDKTQDYAQETSELNKKQHGRRREDGSRKEY